MVRVDAERWTKSRKKSTRGENEEADRETMMGIIVVKNSTNK